MCFSGTCPIEDLATDLEIEFWISDFMSSKNLYFYTEDLEVLRRMHERLGLYDEPQEHLKIEELYAQWRNKKALDASGSKQTTSSGSSALTPRRGKKLLGC
jgi:hypothetical protein